ncbi:MAG TPA: ribosome maturation factor RimP [Actinomycetospora sp.]|uniref:ribosome maturation factor RimP n=1 Tax=Actinomycetospora sp. TaxID=1872135 RepID=UPI002F3E98A6
MSALSPVVDDVVARAGFVLDELDVRPAGRRLVVRVTVDSPDVPGVEDGPTGGVDLDAVAELSRDVSAAVDARESEDPAVRDALAGAYTLEVTTPGTDRPLTEPRHWRRAWLRRVAVTLAGGEAVTGRVGGVVVPDEGPATVTLAVGKALRTVALDEVTRAIVEVEFKPAPDAEVEALRAARRDSEEEQ